MNEETRSTLLSVVIIGRNEGARLRRCLASVEAMRRPAGAMEVIYVDSDSIDGSVEIAERTSAKVIRLHPEWPTAALARNSGWKAARSPFVFFVDGDTVIDPDFVTRALPSFAEAKVAAVDGLFRELRSDTGFFDRVLALDWTHHRPGPADYCSGTAIFRRSALEAVNGYDESLIASEEPEMCHRMRRLGYVILRLDIPMSTHELGIRRWSQYWRRAVRTGFGFAEVSERFRGTRFAFKEGVVRSNRIWGVFLVLMSISTAGSGVALRSWIPLGFAFLAITALVSWNMWRIRSRVRGETGTSLLYGIHWVTKQVPMLLGQFSYLAHKWTGRRRRLIEYKTISENQIVL